MKNYDEFIEGLKKDEKIPDKVMDRFEATLHSLPDKNKKLRKRFKWPSAVAAAAVLVCTMSVGVYAAGKLYDYVVQENNEDGLNVEMTKNTDEYIPPITVTPNYLPEGYKISEEGKAIWKYSPNGENGAIGITISDAGWLKSFSIPRVSSYEQKQIGNAQALYTYIEGAEYPYHIFLFYEEDGHAVEVFGCKDLSEAEILKVCENITYVESPEKDPDHTYAAFSEDRLDAAKGSESIDASQVKEIDAKNLMGIGDAISLTSSSLSKEVEGSISVKDIKITDEVNSELITKDTVTDYDRVMGNIENNKLKPYTRIVTEWTGDKYADKELGTVNVKNVEVTLEVKNTSEADYDEVNIQPRWGVFKKTDSGNYVRSFEIPGYTIGDNYAGCNYYNIASDGFAYYFDSSSFPQDSHFFNMSLKAGETKEVHLWFAIPEDELQDSYLSFDNAFGNTTQLVKIAQQ